jgi:hypothetical protein
MRRIRTMALCLVAVFAIAASYAASASAAPRYYTSSNTCTKKFGELAEAGECIIAEKPNKTQEISFTETGGEALLKGALKITCASNVGKGKIFNEGKRGKVKKLKVTYSECHKTGSATPCGSKFVKVEEKEKNTGKILTQGLKGDVTRASEIFGGALTVVQNLTPEKEGPTTKGFTEFFCGEEKTGSIKVLVRGHILIRVAPVLAAPDETKLATKGETFNEEKGFVSGCSEAAGKSQKYLFVEAAGACQFLKVVENGAELEPSVNVGTNELKFGTKKVELVE